ncbi:MAG TPA: isoprenyl transferase [Clostridiales bacterium]|jgi:undecaprenyl diphosphate synthase|nr:isoprenyl transferase [Clostridiales bacterium]
MNELKHVAIIMDGNGRWAKKNRIKTALGHRRGVEALRDIIRYSSDEGIFALSIYAFSTENWKRSKEEIESLMQLIVDFFRSEIDELDEKNVNIRILGDINGLPEKQRTVVLKAQERTSNNTGLRLNIALNYGARAEIVHAAKQLAQKAFQGDLSVEEITEETFENHLYTVGLPPVDLLIRTSGEQRLSNFLLYQLAYAEMIFPEVLWPDYTVEMYQTHLKEFANRERRFGGRKG